MILNENNCSSCSYFCSTSATFFFNLKTTSSSSSFFTCSADSSPCSSDINRSFSDFSTKSELNSLAGVSVSAVSGTDVAPAIFVCDELLHTTSLLSFTECITSLNSDSKLFATVVAVKRGVGGGRLRGELRFHAKILGTAPGLGLTLWLRLLVKSSGLKMPRANSGSFLYSKIRPHKSSYSMEPLFSEVYIVSKTKEGNLFARIYSRSRLSFFVHSGTQRCVGISQLIFKEKKGFVDQSYSLQRLIGSFPLLSFKK